MKQRNSGFTLMEILLVAVLMATIAVAVTQAFANGLKLWARSQHLVIESDLMIFVDKFGEDARGAQLIKGIPFKGTAYQVSWPATVITGADLRSARSEEGRTDQIGAVQYYFDPADKKIYRRQANYGQALKGLWGQAVTVAANVEELVFRYYSTSTKGSTNKGLIDDEIPLGILVEISFAGEGNGRKLHRFFPIPVGGGL